jgi:hypothetical protein
VTPSELLWRPSCYSFMHGTALPYPAHTYLAALSLLVESFNFPSTFPLTSTWNLTFTPASVTSYSHELATRTSALREIATLLVAEQRAHHREFINACQPDPKIYSVGETVFARRATQSDAGRGQVDKLIYPFTGPWLITCQT